MHCWFLFVCFLFTFKSLLIVKIIIINIFVFHSLVGWKRKCYKWNTVVICFHYFSTFWHTSYLHLPLYILIYKNSYVKKIDLYSSMSISMSENVTRINMVDQIKGRLFDTVNKGMPACFRATALCAIMMQNSYK